MPYENGKRRELTRDERTEILLAHKGGMGYREISRKFPISESGARKLVKRWNATHTTRDENRPGRPPIVDKHDRRCIREISEDDPFATLVEITESSRLNVCVDTIGRVLRADGFYVRMARKTPLMNAKTRAKRREFANTWTDMPKAWFRRKIYTDEVRLEVGFRGKKEGVRRPPNTELQPNHMVPTMKGDRTAVDFYGGITHGAHLLVAIRKRTEEDWESKNDKLGFNGTQYRNEILQPHLLKMYRREKKKHRRRIMIIEDGHGAHKAGPSEILRKKLGVEKLDFPPYSPDLNPIENVWGLWKRALRRLWRHPENRPHGREEVIEQAQRVWKNLPWEKIYGMIDRMGNTMRAVRRHRGWPTKW